MNIPVNRASDTHRDGGLAPTGIIARLEAAIERGRPVSYAMLRAAFGIAIMTHGIPKMLGTSHGSMANPMAGSANLIANVLHLPFAPQLAMLVALLETFGGLGLVIGLGTRPFAAMLGIQMIFICVALGPTWPWIDRGIEYPFMLGFTALAIAFQGGGAFSIDRMVCRIVRRRGGAVA